MNSDLTTVRQHLESLCKPWSDIEAPTRMEIRCLKEGGLSVSQIFDPHDENALSSAISKADRNNQAGYNVYVCVNPIKEGTSGAASDSNIVAACFCFADADNDGDAERLRSSDKTPHGFEVITGQIPHLRIHAYWQLEEPCLNLIAWTSMQKAIAQHHGTDSSICNPSRIMRLAGFVSHPSEGKVLKRYVVEHTSMSLLEGVLTTVSFETLMAEYQDVPDVRKASSPTNVAAIDIDIGHQAMDRALAENNIMAGNDWHHNVVRLVGSYVGKGMSDSEIHALTDRFTLGSYTVEDTQREVQQAIDGARDKGWTPGPQQTAQQVLAAPAVEIALTPDTDATEQKPRQPIFWAKDAKAVLKSNYMIKGWIGTQQMSVVYGPSNVGKSFFCLDLSYAVAAGAEWQGNRVKSGPVLYLATEGGNAFHNRVVALRMQYGDDDVPLAIRPSPVNLLDPEADLAELGALCAEIEDEYGPIALIVIDTLSRAMAGGNENGPEDMTAFISNVDALRDHTRAHIMIVHHTGKDTARGARGHSSLRAATDTEIELEIDGGVRVATATKQRDMEPKQPIVFTLKVHELGFDEDGDVVTTCTIRAATAEDVADRKIAEPTGKNQKKLVGAFKQLRGEGRGQPNPAGAGFPEPRTYWAINETEFREFAVGKLVGANTSNLFRIALEGLIDSRYICLNDGFLWIAKKSGKVT